MDPFPSINKVYSLVVHEESNCKVVPAPSSIDESSIWINASDASKPFGRGKGYRLCTVCNRPGYTIEYCYQKHEYPTRNKSKHYVNASSSDTSMAKSTHSNSESLLPASGNGLTRALCTSCMLTSLSNFNSLITCVKHS